MPYHPERMQDLQLRANQLFELAETLPHGGEKDALLRRALGLENTSRAIDRWASSPGLRAPK